MSSFIDNLKRLGVCPEAIKWAANYKTIEEAWNVCDRGDWLLWYAGKMSGKPGSDRRKKLTLAACQCARLALPYTDDDRAEQTIVIAEQWALGNESVTLEDVKNAASAAYASAAAAYSAYSAYSASAAHAAASAASAASASYASAAASYAVSAASAYASSYASYASYVAFAAAKKEVLKQCADIVRQFYPEPPIVSLINRRNNANQKETLCNL